MKPQSSTIKALVRAQEKESCLKSSLMLGDHVGKRYLYELWNGDKEIFVYGLRAAGIYKAIKNTQYIMEKVENPFNEV